MKTKHQILRNRIMTILVTVVFVAIACFVLRGLHLTEYTGSLDENLSYELPQGYELQESDSDSNVEQKVYRRTADNTAETITLYYEGMYVDKDQYSVGNETPIRIDPSTEVLVSVIDWDNYDNELDYLILHDNEAYYIIYKCNEKDKGEYYYSSCSEAQQDELLAFISTFDYHRPDGSDKNVIQRLYHNLGTGGFIICVLAILFFVGIPVAISLGSLSRSGSKDDEIISSRDLHESMNRERNARGEDSLPSINNVQGVSSNNLARRDHSWSSVPDFFIKLFRNK